MPRTTSQTNVKAGSSKVDAYIAKSPAYAQPIMKKLRQAFLKSSPKLEETIKWRVPHYEYRGLVGGFAAFKNHVTFVLWKANEIPDPEKLFADKTCSINQVKFETPSEVPTQKVLTQYIKKAVALNDANPGTFGKRAAKKATKKSTSKSMRVPAVLKAALAKNKKAQATFTAFSPTHKREYIEWITDAKRDETRTRRVKQAIQWMTEGKPRNWKYLKK